MNDDTTTTTDTSVEVVAPLGSHHQSDMLHLPDPTLIDGHGTSSFREVLANSAFRSLWIAQVFSQLGQNLMWIVLGTYIAGLTHQATPISLTIVSAMLAQFIFSPIAGVLVDRQSKRTLLVGSNAARIVIAALFLTSFHLDRAWQPAVITVLIFIFNAVSQFFTPAEAVTIPLLVAKKNLIAATSLFNITLNACQAAPILLGLILYDWIGVNALLGLVTAAFVIATVLVATLPHDRAPVGRSSLKGSLDESLRHIIADVRDALRFLSHDPGLRLTLFQINVAPTFLFIFSTLGLTFVHETFNLGAEKAWILLLPAGVGLVFGAIGMGRFAARARKEDLINIGLVVMGLAVSILGAVSVIVDALTRAAGSVRKAIVEHVHALPPVHNIGLVPTAMLIACIIGLGIAFSTIPAQTLVLERTDENMRGRVLSLQQLVGGAVPIIPLLAIAPLADRFSTATVMTGLGVIIVIIGALSVRLDRKRL